MVFLVKKTHLYTFAEDLHVMDFMVKKNKKHIFYVEKP
jgi:hypothetical protein